MLIGSKAAKVWFPDFREPKDEDHFSPDPDLPGDNFWHESFPKEWAADFTALPNMLYTIKVSHAPWALANNTWEKHMQDILFFQDKGVEFDRDMYDILRPVWLETHGKKRVNLNMTKDDFFNDAVDRKYDHDSLHESVAYGDRPMYTNFLVDGAQVDIDNKKFWHEDVTNEERFKTIREEIYATALERWVIPKNYRISPRLAYAWAMKKSITSLFKGEWALFIILNYKDLYKPDMDYVAHHKSKAHKLIALPPKEKVVHNK
jgi:hypothetical protein